MGRATALRLAVIGLYAAYWSVLVFGFVPLDRSDVPALSRELYYAAAIGVPCFLLGVAIGRWWAPAVGAVFVAFVLIPERCVETREASDAFELACNGFALSDTALALAATTPFIIAGVVAVKGLAVWRHRDRGDPPTARAPSRVHPRGAPARSSSSPPRRAS